MKTMIDRIRAEEEHVLLFANGDTFHGTYPVVKTKGESLIPILNELGFDAMTGIRISPTDPNIYNSSFNN